jgi:glutathione S-transferase
MHSGFGALRDRFPMNIEASLPEVGARCVAEFPAVATDLARIDAMWTEQLAASGGPLLFGAFSAADAFYAPVAARLKTYAPPIGAAAAGYVDRVLAVPSVRAWCDAAREEHDFIKEDEPYRDAAS